MPRDPPGFTPQETSLGVTFHLLKERPGRSEREDVLAEGGAGLTLHYRAGGQEPVSDTELCPPARMVPSRKPDGVPCRDYRVDFRTADLTVTAPSRAVLTGVAVI